MSAVTSTVQDAKKVPVTITWVQSADTVFVEGSWDQFSKKTKLEATFSDKEGAPSFACNLYLSPGKVSFRYFIDNEYRIDPNLETHWHNGEEYNILVIDADSDDGIVTDEDVVRSPTTCRHTEQTESLVSKPLSNVIDHHSISAPCSPRSRHNRTLRRSSVPTTPPLYKRSRKGRPKKKKKPYNGPDIDAIREEVVKREQEWREAWILQERRHHHIREHEKTKLRTQFKQQRQKWLGKIQDFHKGSKELNAQVEALKIQIEDVEMSKHLAQSNWNRQKDNLEQEIKMWKDDAGKKEYREKQMKHDNEELNKEVAKIQAQLTKSEEEHREKENEFIKADQQNTKLVLKVQEQLEEAQKNENSMQIQLEESENKIRSLSEQLNLKEKELSKLEETQIASKNRDLISKRKIEEDRKKFSATIKNLENEILLLNQGKEEKAENNVMVKAIQQELDTANEAISSLKNELKKQKENVTKMENKLVNSQNTINKLQIEKESQLNLQLEEKNKLNGTLSEENIKLKSILADEKTHKEKLSSQIDTLQAELKKTLIDNKSEIQELSIRNEKLEAENTNLRHKCDKQISEMDHNHQRKVLEMQSVLNNLSSKLEEARSQHTLNLAVWDRQKKDLEKQLQHHINKGNFLYSKFSNLQEHTKNLRSVVSKMKDEQLDATTLFTRRLQNTRSTLLTIYAKQNAILINTMKKYKMELSARRKYFNLVQELRGNIRVFCRVRPLLGNEKKNGQAISFSNEEEKGQERSLLLKTKIKSHHQETKTCPFEFDRVFSPTAKQEEVFSDTKFLIQSVMDGYNVCIFAYGQTGSGKTYTIEGSQSNPGVNVRALKELFRIKQDRSPDYTYKIKISILEIYKEQIRDLLADQKANPWDETIKPKIMKGERGMFVHGLTEWGVKCLGDVFKGINKGKSNRSTGVTNMNEHSSRSHMLLSVQVFGRNSVAGMSHYGKLHLIDLAGSERLSRSHATGERLKEAQSINKSLAALGNVIEALQKKNSHVPYRNSKLTFMLQDSLGGHAKTLMFINVSPAAEDADETNCSLTFATRVRQVELGKSTKNTTYDKSVVSSKSSKSNDKKNNEKNSHSKKSLHYVRSLGNKKGIASSSSNSKRAQRTQC